MAEHDGNDMGFAQRETALVHEWPMERFGVPVCQERDFLTDNRYSTPWRTGWPGWFLTQTGNGGRFVGNRSGV